MKCFNEMVIYFLLKTAGYFFSAFRSARFASAVDENINV
jgi:hypothetical protein